MLLHVRELRPLHKWLAGSIEPRQISQPDVWRCVRTHTPYLRGDHGVVAVVGVGPARRSSSTTTSSSRDLFARAPTVAPATRQRQEKFCLVLQLYGGCGVWSLVEGAEENTTTPSCTHSANRRKSEIKPSCVSSSAPVSFSPQSRSKDSSTARAGESIFRTQRHVKNSRSHAFFTRFAFWFVVFGQSGVGRRGGRYHHHRHRHAQEGFFDAKCWSYGSLTP